jgi:hypothetical protein
VIAGAPDKTNLVELSGLRAAEPQSDTAKKFV